MPALAVDDSLPQDSLMLARLVEGRHSCRGFLPTPVPRATINAMLAIAQGTASWCNSQPWEVLVTEGVATERFREKLYAFATGRSGADKPHPAEQPDFPFPARYAGIYQERRRATGWALYRAVGVEKGDRAASARQTLENFRLFGAPHVLILTTEADLGVYGAIDCGAYVAHVLLAAQSLGLATIAQAALAGVADFLHGYFDIPAHRKIVCAISFGYADPDHPANSFRTPREALENVVRYVE